MKRPGARNRLRLRLRSQRGLSLVEILIGALILSGLSLAAFRFYEGQHAQYVQQSDVTDMQQNLRVVMDELTRQIRQAGYRAFGVDPVVILGNNDWLLVRYHDGVRVRTQLFYPYVNPETGRTDLMTMLDGEGSLTFAEGIDSVRFTGGGTGAGIEWVTVDLVAKSQREGFQSASTYGETGSDKHLYRRLSSTVKLRNR